MNQLLADLFLSLPRQVTEPRAFGSIWLALCWLGYFFFVRATLMRTVRERCDTSLLASGASRPWHRILYGVVRERARLDEGGLYGIHLGTLLLLAVTTVIHALLFWLDADGYVLAGTADRVLLTAVVCAEGAVCLWMQPATTVERRMRWGFSRKNAVVHAVIWEAVLVALALLWLYDAWFLPEFVSI